MKKLPIPEIRRAGKLRIEESERRRRKKRETNAPVARSPNSLVCQVVLAVVSLVIIPEGSAVVFAVAVQYPKLSF